MKNKKAKNRRENRQKQAPKTEHLQPWQFKPGQCGNPKGRPPSTGLVATLRAAVSQTVSDGRRVEEVIVENLVAQALRGRQDAIEAIFDRLEGKPRQRVDLSVNDIGMQVQRLSHEDRMSLLKSWHRFEEVGEWPTTVN